MSLGLTDFRDKPFGTCIILFEAFFCDFELMLSELIINTIFWKLSIYRKFFGLLPSSVVLVYEAKVNYFTYDVVRIVAFHF
jgi:hypothetical protein